MYLCWFSRYTSPAPVPFHDMCWSDTKETKTCIFLIKATPHVEKRTHWKLPGKNFSAAPESNTHTLGRDAALSCSHTGPVRSCVWPVRNLSTTLSLYKSTLPDVSVIFQTRKKIWAIPEFPAGQGVLSDLYLSTHRAVTETSVISFTKRRGLGSTCGKWFSFYQLGEGDLKDVRS